MEVMSYRCYVMNRQCDAAYSCDNRCGLLYGLSTPNHEVGHEEGTDIEKNKNERRTNNMSPRAWNMEKGNKTAKFTIATPKGAYTPESDNLEDEIRAAARFGGLKHPVVQVHGEYIDCSDDLPVELISKLEAGTTVAVSAYDIAG